MKNALTLLRIWIAVLAVAFIISANPAQADELLHLENEAFEIRLKNHTFTTGESAEVLRFRSTTADQANLTTRLNPSQIVVSLPSPHAQFDGVIPVIGSKTVQQIQFQNNPSGGQITITLKGDTIPNHVWDKKFDALMIAFSVPATENNSAAKAPAKTQADLHTSTQKVHTITKPSTSPLQKAQKGVPEFRASFKPKSQNSPSQKITPVQSKHGSDSGIEKLMEDYLYGIGELQPDTPAAKKKNTLGNKELTPRAEPHTIIPISATTKATDPRKTKKSIDANMATAKQPEFRRDQKIVARTDSLKSSRKVEELALALLTPDDQPLPIKSAPKRIVKAPALSNAANTKPKAKAAIITAPKEPVATVTSKTAKPTAAKAPRTMVATRDIHREQLLNNITFVKGKGSNAPVLQLALTKKASFSIVKKTANTYGLTIPNCGISQEHLELPYFPPVDFKGLTFLQSARDGKSTTVDMVVERGYKLKAVSSGRNIIVEAKSLL
jgi:hypothetical protein